MKLSTILLPVFTFGLAAAGAYLAAGVAVSIVEDISHSEVKSILAFDGHDWAEVQTDGLDVVLSGEAPTEADRFRAMASAGKIVDASRVIDNIMIEATEELAPPRFSIEILRNDAGIYLIGLVPADPGRDALLDRVSNATDGAPVSDILDVADYPTDRAWDIALSYGLFALSEFDRAKISVSAEGVDVTALADTMVDQARLTETLNRRAPREVAVTVNVTAPRPVISPFTLRFVEDETGASFDACSADTAQARDTILAAARAAGAPETSTCRIGLGVPSPQWAKAMAQSIQAIDSLGAGSITATDADIFLQADETVSQALFDTVTSRLDAELPRVFTLTAQKLEPIVTDDTVEPPLFSATLSPEGQVQLRGDMKDELTQTAAVTVAKARFGSDKVYDATGLRDDLPAGWAVRSIAALDALDVLAHGSVVVTGPAVEIRGKSGDQSASDSISQILANQFEDGTRFEIDVTYDKILDPTLNIPTVPECIGSLQQINQTRKISFDPGAATLDIEGRRVISAMADVLRKCPDFRMEVAGHTDSQGREEMNQELSQSRAEAVIQGLLTERISTRGFSAVGYGETRPIADNDTEEGREQNRRIEFKLLKEGDAPGADAPQGDTSE